MSDFLSRKRLLLIFGLACLLILIFWHLFFKSVLKKLLIEQASLAKIQISEQALDVFFLGITSKDSLDIKLAGLPVVLGPTQVDLKPGSLPALSPKGSFSSSFLDGKLNGTFSYSVNDTLFSTNFVLQGSKIYKYPLLSLLGLTAGNLDLSAQLQNSGRNKTETSRLSVELTGLEIPKATKVPPALTVFPVIIPTLSRGTLLLWINCESTVCKTDKLEFSSSLGEAAGSFQINLSQRPTISLKLKISLTRQGRESVLPYFSLINPAITDNAGKPFSLSVQGPVNQPKVSVVAIEQ